MNKEDLYETLKNHDTKSNLRVLARVYSTHEQCLCHLRLCGIELLCMEEKRIKFWKKKGIYDNRKLSRCNISAGVVNLDREYSASNISRK